MPPSLLRAANLQLLIKRARHRAHNFAVAGQPPHFLPFPYEGLVGQRSDEVAVLLCIEFLEVDGAERGSTPGWSVEKKAAIRSGLFRCIAMWALMS
jgi:hypothetical protein